MRLRTAAFALSTLLAACVTLPAQAPGLDIVAFMSEKPMAALHALAPGRAPIAADGAFGVNAAGGKWYVEEQRIAGDWIARGALARNAAWMDTGARLIDWALARQGANGDFPGQDDAYHSTAFFLSQVGWGISVAMRVDPEGTRKLLGDRIGRLRDAARWVSRRDVTDANRAGQAPYTHRRWVVASALGQFGALMNDNTLTVAARSTAREGLSQQRADGVNPEKGGHDVHYQAFGLQEAARYLAVCDDPAVRAEVAAGFLKGARWLLGRFNAADGSIDATGSTRVGIEAGRSGQIKAVGYTHLVEVFSAAHQLTGEPAFARAAEAAARAKGWMR